MHLLVQIAFDCFIKASFEHILHGPDLMFCVRVVCVCGVRACMHACVCACVCVCVCVCVCTCACVCVCVCVCVLICCILCTNVAGMRSSSMFTDSGKHGKGASVCTLNYIH